VSCTTFFLSYSDVSSDFARLSAYAGYGRDRALIEDRLGAPLAGMCVVPGGPQRQRLAIVQVAI